MNKPMSEKPPRDPPPPWSPLAGACVHEPSGTHHRPDKGPSKQLPGTSRKDWSQQSDHLVPWVKGLETGPQHVLGGPWLKGPYTEPHIQVSETVQSLALSYPEPSFNPGSATSSCVTLGTSLFLSVPLFHFYKPRPVIARTD